MTAPSPPLPRSARAVGRPAPFWLVAAYFQSSLVLGLAAALALCLAADDLARGALAAPDVLLAVHLFGLGFLPFAVAGAALHVLPILLRNSAPAVPAVIALVLLWSGPALAVGLSRGQQAIARPAAAGVAIALVLVAALVVKLAVAAPRSRTLLASRAGVVLSAANAALAFAAGALLLDRGYLPFLGVGHERLIAIHLHLAVLGWLTLLIVTVARTLAPMLALAPSAPARRFPSSELALTGGLWLLVVAIATRERPLALGASLVVLASLASVVRELVRVAREHRLPALEAPLVHLVLGLGFLAQAFALGVLLVARDPRPAELAAYVLWFLGGWAGGVTLGHVGKLLAVSAWMGWPPGPRPSQAWFYPRRLWLLEAGSFSLGIDVLAVGALIGHGATALAGSALMALALLVALAAATATLARAGVAPPAARRRTRPAPTRARLHRGATGSGAAGGLA